MRSEHRRLAIETKNRSVNIRLLREDADVVRQIASRKVIRAVNDDIVIGNNFERVFARETAFVRLDFDRGIYVAQSVSRRIQLFAPDVFCAVQNLALQIAKIDIVEIDEAELSNSSRGEIERSR